MTTTRNRLGSVAFIMVLALTLLLGTASVIGAAGGTHPGNSWRLMVKSAACVKGPVVMLGEIADPVSGVDERTWKSLAGVKLWKASDKPGRPVTITRDKLRKVLRYYMGDMINNLVLPSQMTVQTGGRVITGDELRNRVVVFLTPRANDLGGDVEFKNLRLPMNYFFRNAYDKLEIGLSGDIKPGRNQIKLRSVASDGKVLSSKAGSVFINVWKAVPVAAKPLNRFERVTKDKVSFMRVNMAYKKDIWDGTGGPWRMARTLGRGQAFTLSHLDQVPLIEKGERVNLIYRNKRIRLSIKAEALDEGGMGQQVAVRNLQSKKTILATVVGNDTVLVK
ncbi:flagellar basal body P-ring formation chaperone FlgA [uncultured Pseudodesulfovibrio sp.]|uniref:flagellar basal body P-ring formation chaperone FlgA n=1 Tax=uncultured Pseudodesulfovibrio sp. TaxID=2035858 RepID=UPI0029C7CC56|nr:flagellar basal body P-ring formation chaperone FlgA [uncultured Pseudodesulfovibrio sp.]